MIEDLIKGEENPIGQKLQFGIPNTSTQSNENAHTSVKFKIETIKVPKSEVEEAPKIDVKKIGFQDDQSNYINSLLKDLDKSDPIY